ncbi:YbaN family protein [Polycladidibacter hongkongensis]|uniref:YbaN family protein n=1 Tax=Polycladidibacter hongkongensis TaxID=1647556 RepID=UPI000829D69D|nr:YbaN family protein [Pseudovibrio hongkongensis]
MRRHFYSILGFLLVGIGLVGAVLPLLPTTIFFIAAAGCFAKSNEKFERWILQHKTFGKHVRLWRQHRAISRRSKQVACSGMAMGYVLFWFSASPGPLLAIVVACVLLLCAYYVSSRPNEHSANLSEL